MKKILLAALATLCFGLASKVDAGSLGVSWQPPTTCEDGSAISGCPITGYEIRTSQCSSTNPVAPNPANPPTVTVPPTATSYSFVGTPGGTYWCVTIDATSANGPSVQSNVASGPALPSPGSLAVQVPTQTLKTVDSGNGTSPVYLVTPIPDGWGFTQLGTVPAGTVCNAAVGVNQYNEVPQASVTVSWSTSIHAISIVALCQ